MQGTYRSLQLGNSFYKGLVKHKLAVGFGHSDHVHCTAVPARALKLQVPSTRLHQVLGSLYAQPCCSVPVFQHRRSVNATIYSTTAVQTWRQRQVCNTDMLSTGSCMAVQCYGAQCRHSGNISVQYRRRVNLIQNRHNAVEAKISEDAGNKSRQRLLQI